MSGGEDYGENNFLSFVFGASFVYDQKIVNFLVMLKQMFLEHA